MVANHTCKWSQIAVKIVTVYKCDMCHKHTQKNTTLSFNSAVTRMDSECCICKKSFGLKASLLVHRRKHAESKPYICVNCNKSFVTRGGLVIHKAGHNFKQVEIGVFDYDDVDGSHYNQCQNESKKSPIYITSKSSSIADRFLKVPIDDKSKSAIVITQNSTCQENSTSIFGEKIADCNKINNVIPAFVSPVPYEELYMNMSEHKLEHGQLLRSNENYFQKQSTADVDQFTAPYAYQVTNLSTDVSENISNPGLQNEQTVIDSKTVCPQLEYDIAISYDDELYNNDWYPSVDKSIILSNITITEQNMRSQVDEKLDQTLKEIKTDLNYKNELDRRPCTRLKTKLGVQNNTVHSKVLCTRMLTRSCVKMNDISPDKVHCTNNLTTKNVRQTNSSRQITKSKTKIMVIGSVEEDAYNVDADSCIKNNLKKDVVKKVLYFQCSMCPTKHLSERDLANHEKLHFAKKAKLFQCDICKKVCSDSSKLKDHIRLHTGEKPFTCKTCQKSFRMKACLNTHTRVHSQEKPYSCSMCSKVFKYQNTLYRHITTHQSHADTKLKCKNCDKRFMSQHSLLGHNKNVRKCDLCSQVFCSFSELNLHKHVNHVNTFSERKSDGKYCQYCDKTYKSNDTLSVHMQKHARKGMHIMFPCPSCQESFETYDKLRAHRKTHVIHVKRVKCITCPWSHCGKKLTSQTRLNSHIKRHNGETLYLCHRCGMKFTDCVFYFKHRRACYQRITTYDCVMCGKVLSGYSALQKHIMWHTGEKPYQCEVCGARFIDNTHLKRHKRIHVRKGEMPPFEDNCIKSQTAPVEWVVNHPCVAQPQENTTYVASVEIGNEEVVTYCVEEQSRNVVTEKPFLK